MPHPSEVLRNLPYYNVVYAKLSGTGGCAIFDAKHKISGQACSGKPSADYVPTSQVGLSYNRSYFCN